LAALSNPTKPSTLLLAPDSRKALASAVETHIVPGALDGRLLAAPGLTVARAFLIDE
jgi:hypothetical protein